ncbi:MAG: DUF2061 domain-containing protein [Acidobacteriota bacterium]|mgnify:CR=1 FL=1
MDTHSRSWAKSFSWRIIGVVILGAITYSITRSWEQTGTITAVFHVIRVILYYWHERLWEKVSWGKLKHPLACLHVRKDLTPEDYEVIRSLLDQHRYSAKEPEYQI